ncbi:MAG: fluoride efflux transporter FluC [Planctomycetota bacterium]
MNQPLFYLALAAAGGIGVLLRAGCTALAIRGTAGGSLWAAPTATLVVNVLGSFLFGVVYALTGPRPGLAPALQPILLVGLLGGFTTYSTFSFQTVEMLAAGRLGSALIYVAATNLLAVAAAWAGLRIASG